MLFLEIRCCNMHDLQEETDRIMLSVDDMLSAAEFEKCNKWLEDLELESLALPLLRTVLVATYAAKDRLPARPTLFSKAWGLYLAAKGEAKTKRLLESLR